MAADEPAGPPPATAKSKSYRGLAGFITSLKYHLEKREAGNFFKPVGKLARGDAENNDCARIAPCARRHAGCMANRPLRPIACIGLLSVSHYITLLTSTVN